MRRILAVAVLVLLVSSACVWSPGVHFPDWDRPVGIGASVRGARKPTPPPQPARPCMEISRMRCDFMHCGGTGFDFVTYQCQGQGRSGRCVANGGCSLSPKPRT